MTGPAEGRGPSTATPLRNRLRGTLHADILQVAAARMSCSEASATTL